MKNQFLEVFEDSVTARIIDFLLNTRMDHTKKEISESLGVGWKKVSRLVDILEERGILKRTRKIGRGLLYRINEDSEIVRVIEELDSKIR